MKAYSDDVAQAALDLMDGPEVPYSLGGTSTAGMDCRGLILYCVRQAGGTIKYAGSNDMYRNACEWRGTIKEAKAEGKLVPGAMLFIVEPTGVPAKYKADGLGNASHVGIYIGRNTIYSIDASASAGMVRTRDKRNGEHCWTHAAWFKEVEYMIKKNKPVQPEQSETIEDAPVTPDLQEVKPDRPTVKPESKPQSVPKRARIVGSSRLNMRSSPRMDAQRIGGMEPGTIVEVLDGMDDWWKVRTQFGGKAYTGWAMSEYMRAV